MSDEAEADHRRQIAELTARNKDLSEQVKRLVRTEARLFAFQEELDLQRKTYLFLANAAAELAESKKAEEIFRIAVNATLYGFYFQRGIILAADEAGSLKVLERNGFDETPSVAEVTADNHLVTALLRGEPRVTSTEEDTRSGMVALKAILLMDELVALPLGPSDGHEGVIFLVAGNDLEHASLHTRVREDSEVLLALATFASHVRTTLENARSYEEVLLRSRREEEARKAAIRELSTPIIEVWKGVLCLPVVGALDSTRAATMTDTLLRAIVEKKAKCAIVDITASHVMDSSTVDDFLRMTRAVRLLGADCILTGVNPAVAQAMVDMGGDLSETMIYRTLRVALQRYVEGFAEDR